MAEPEGSLTFKMGREAWFLDWAASLAWGLKGSVLPSLYARRAGYTLSLKSLQHRAGSHIKLPGLCWSLSRGSAASSTLHPAVMAVD